MFFMILQQDHLVRWCLELFQYVNVYSGICPTARVSRLRVLWLAVTVST